ncbi:hypothetical protein ACX0MU_07275 [Rhizorhabdus wittichii]
MQPAVESLLWYRNAPEQSTFILKDGDNPYDLTGRTLRLDVRLYPGAAGAPLLTLGMAGAATEPGFWIEAPITGTIYLNPPSLAQLAALPVAGEIMAGLLDTLVYDILLIAPDGVPELLMEGNIILKSGVTRI